jgi:hypothetical protein
MKQEIGHARIVSDRFAIFDDFPESMSDWADEFKLSRDDCLGEVTFANEVWYHVNVIAVDHAQNLAEAWFLFPKGAMHFRKERAPNDLVRMLKGRRTRIGIQRGAMAYQYQRALLFDRHLLNWMPRRSSSNGIHAGRRGRLNGE